MTPLIWLIALRQSSAESDSSRASLFIDDGRGTAAEDADQLLEEGRIVGLRSLSPGKWHTSIVGRQAAPHMTQMRPLSRRLASPPRSALRSESRAT